MEALGHGPLALYDRAKLKQQTDRPTVPRQALQACRKGGTVSIPGVYAGVIDKVDYAAAPSDE
jgi:threonine dehydrogenase-like Zn-dependent dehydrogenase